MAIIAHACNSLIISNIKTNEIWSQEWKQSGQDGNLPLDENGSLRNPGRVSSVILNSAHTNT